MAKKTQVTETLQAPDTAVIEQAPQPIQYTAPRQKRVERQGSQSEPFTRVWPQVRGGTCEFCGTLDRNMPSEYQYKLCPHYRGMQLRCSYCDASKNPDDVINHTILNIRDHPTDPSALVVWCDSYECSRKHEKRFKIA